MPSALEVLFSNITVFWLPTLRVVHPMSLLYLK